MVSVFDRAGAERASGVAWLGRKHWNLCELSPIDMAPVRGLAQPDAGLGKGNLEPYTGLPMTVVAILPPKTQFP